jgi:hypothetical protein
MNMGGRQNAAKEAGMFKAVSKRPRRRTMAAIQQREIKRY